MKVHCALALWTAVHHCALCFLWECTVQQTLCICICICICVCVWETVVSVVQSSFLWDCTVLLHCTALCTVLLMRLHCAADKGARRPLDEKVAKNFYKSPHLRNTSKQPTMKKIYKRYIAMSRISHINWILLIEQRCPGAWVWTWRCPWLYWTFKSFESSVTCCIRIYLKLL